MKFTDYVEKHRDIFEPIDNVVSCIPVLSILLSVAQELPNEEMREEIENVLEKWREKLGETEVKENSEE